ncbi:MAG: hypothetical protein ACYDGM_08275, partial [Vulcanimicrobiaceae bacterium]
MEPSAPLPLRPLSIGEMFDRAVTLYVRNFAVFTLIVLTVSIPLGIVQYAISGTQAQALQSAISVLEHPTAKPGGKATPPDPFGGLTPSQLGGYALVILVALIAAPFATNAVAIGVASLYTGKRPAFGKSFAAVLRRWPQIFGTLFVWLGVAIGAYIALIVATIVLVAIAIGLAKVSPALSILIILLGIALGLAILVLAIVMLLAASFSFFTVCIEERPVVESIKMAVARLFNRVEFWKAVLIGLAYFGIELGVASIAGSLGIAIILLLKNVALQIAVSTIFNALLSAFLTVLVAVYYYDVRIRREGFDLEA